MTMLKTFLFVTCAVAMAALWLYAGPVKAESAEKMAAVEKPALATFAGGCFWCMEKPFDKLEGVLSTTSGYSGGWVDGFTLAYYDPAGGTALSQVEVLFYENDPNSPDFPGGDPASLLLGSYTLTDLPGDGAHVIAVDVSDSPLLVPEHVWVEFDFTNSPEAGLVLFDPPTVGSSADLFEVHSIDIFVGCGGFLSQASHRPRTNLDTVSLQFLA